MITTGSFCHDKLLFSCASECIKLGCFSTYRSVQFFGATSLNQMKNNKNLNILQLICPTGFYGAERWILALAKYLLDDGVFTISTAICLVLGVKPKSVKHGFNKASNHWGTFYQIS